MANQYVVGGDKILRALKRYEDKLTGSPVLAVGFLENATYPDGGLPVAAVAMIQEFGATINRPAGKITVYRRRNKAGTGFARNGRFVKQKEANFSSTHDHDAYTIHIPPRPFFRTMIAQNEKTWAPELARLLKRPDMNPLTALNIMGALIRTQLQASIIAMNEPPNAPATIRAKRAAKPLVDTVLMLRSVNFAVED